MKLSAILTTCLLVLSFQSQAALSDRVATMDAVGCGTFSFFGTRYFTLTHYKEGNKEAMLAVGHANVNRSLLMRGLFKPGVVSPEDRERIVEKMDEVNFRGIRPNDELLVENRGGQTLAAFTGHAGRAEIDGLEDGLFGRVLRIAQQRIRGWRTTGCGN